MRYASDRGGTLRNVYDSHHKHVTPRPAFNEYPPEVATDLYTLREARDVKGHHRGRERA